MEWSLFLMIILVNCPCTGASFIETPKETEVCEGADANLTWVFSNAAAQALVQWSVNGTTTVARLSSGITYLPGTGYAGRVQNDGNGGLIITSVTSADSGTYKCVVSYSDATPLAENEITLNVYSAINTPLQITEVKSESSATLSSSLTDSSITYTWTTPNGNALGTPITVNSNGNYTLCISGGRAQCLSPSLSSCVSYEVSGLVSTTTTTTTPSPTTTPTTTTPSPPNKDYIIGGVVGGIGGLIIVCVIIYLVKRSSNKKKRNKYLEKNEQNGENETDFAMAGARKQTEMAAAWKQTNRSDSGMSSDMKQTNTSDNGMSNAGKKTNKSDSGMSDAGKQTNKSDSGLPDAGKQTNESDSGLLGIGKQTNKSDSGLPSAGKQTNKSDSGLPSAGKQT